MYRQQRTGSLSTPMEQTLRSPPLWIPLRQACHVQKTHFRLPLKLQVQWLNWKCKVATPQRVWQQLLRLLRAKGQNIRLPKKLNLESARQLPFKHAMPRAKEQSFAHPPQIRPASQQNLWRQLMEPPPLRFFIKNHQGLKRPRLVTKEKKSGGKWKRREIGGNNWLPFERSHGR